MEARCVKRILKDLQIYNESNLEKIWLWTNNDDICDLRAIIIGPEDTAYADTFLFFKIIVDTDYPLKNPTVTHITTVMNTQMRLHPNLYGNGKVCLSILGTFSGPSWSPMYNLTTILIQIQSLLDKEPWKHEPGYETKEYCNYNKYIEYGAISCGVVEILMRKNEYPDEIYKKIREHFFKNREKYIERLQKFKGMKTIKSGFIFSDVSGEYDRLDKFLKSYK